MYLVDTNVISEACRKSQPAVNWLRSVPPDSIYLSVVTLGEIMKGIAIKEKKDRQMATQLAEWLYRLRIDHQNRILGVSDMIAIEWGRIAASRTRGDIDGLIAATAIVHNFILVTRNVDDFDDLPVVILNPWNL